MVNWPKRIQGGRVCNEVISSLDIFPTIANVCAAQLPPTTEGQDLMPLLTNPAAKSALRTLYWRQGNRAALRQGPWKIVSPNMRAQARIWELYNIDSDIGESRDLAAEYPKQFSELRQAWDKLNAQMLAPLF